MEKYSRYYHRDCLAYWPEHIRKQWGELSARIQDERKIHPIDAEVIAFNSIQAKLVKAGQENHELDWKALGFGKPAGILPDIHDFPDPDSSPLDSNGYTQTFRDDDGEIEYFYLYVNDLYLRAAAECVEYITKLPSPEKKVKVKAPVTAALDLKPDSESRLIVPVPVDGPVVQESVEPVVLAERVIRIDPAACKPVKVAPKKAPKRGKGKHDKSAGTFFEV